MMLVYIGLLVLFVIGIPIIIFLAWYRVSRDGFVINCGVSPILLQRQLQEIEADRIRNRILDEQIIKASGDTLVTNIVIFIKRRYIGIRHYDIQSNEFKLGYYTLISTPSTGNIHLSLQNEQNNSYDSIKLSEFLDEIGQRFFLEAGNLGLVFTVVEVGQSSKSDFEYFAALISVKETKEYR